MMNSKAHFRCTAQQQRGMAWDALHEGRGAVQGIEMQMMRGYKLIWMIRVRAAAFAVHASRN